MSLRFSDLPLEIRERIWQFSIPDDEPEVCIVWPIILDDREGPMGGEPSYPCLVDTCFPTAMHVCRESRAVVQNPKLSRVRFRNSSIAGCPVPYRHFRAELDTMFWGSENFYTLSCSANRVDILDLRDVRFLAVEIGLGFENQHMFAQALAYFLPQLRTLSFVLPDSTSSIMSAKSFRQPARRCRLMRISPEAGSKLIINTAALLDAEDSENYWGPGSLDEIIPEKEHMPLMPNALQMIRQLLDMHHSYIEEHAPRSRFEDVLLVAQTFIEYQTDGSWKEICAERTFAADNWLERTFAHSGAYVPAIERPDVRSVRPNDIDGDFKVVYEPFTSEGSLSEHWANEGSSVVSAG